MILTETITFKISDTDILKTHFKKKTQCDRAHGLKIKVRDDIYNPEWEKS